MTIETNTIVSMTDANQNFSKVTRIVDTYGSAVIFKNNAPRYLVTEFSLAASAEVASTEDALASSGRMMKKYDKAFKELAK